MFRDQFSRVGGSLVRTLRLAMVLMMLSLLAINRAQAQNPVIDWDAIASTTIVTNGHESSVAAAVWFAYVHLAIYDAVNAIDHQHQPYLFTTDPPAGASEDAPPSLRRAGSWSTTSPGSRRVSMGSLRLQLDRLPILPRTSRPVRRLENQRRRH